ncbi:MAG TPA: chemotaxis protein CheA, partial [Dongiaceae bacterium]|nr:chemotaxis protein CheA [Dongiaceae bacterium]
LSQFHQVFFEESFEGLQTMESSLLELDCASPDAETINAIFRAAHSIKGSSSTFGFTPVAEFTHVLETLLDQVRVGQRSLNAEIVDLLLRSVDCLGGMLRSLQGGTALDVAQSQALIAAFNTILADKPVATIAVPAASAASASASKDSATQGWIIDFIPSVNVLRTGNEPARMFRELAELGTLQTTALLDRLPLLNALTPEECHLGWQMRLTTAADKKKIEEVFEWVADESELRIEPVPAAQSAAAVPELQAAPLQATSLQAVSSAPVVIPTDLPELADKTDVPARSARAAEAASIRVSIDKIDSLVNLVGELVITQSMLGQLGTDFDMSRLARLQEGLAQLEHNTRELQESVMRIRMLPISFTFSRFPRMVRDLSRQLGKKVELKLSGEQTELDKTVMEKIGDPLVHLVRNAIDHGLETPEQRRAAGKPEIGTISLNACHQGGNILIDIRDDGRGLNRDRIRAKAIASQLISPTDILSDEQIQDLIFRPGFSTAEQVTDVSGRGVGMDVVRRNIQELSGSIDVKSVAGVGSTFTIRLPLTLAILDGQLIQVGDQVFIIPLVAIVESLLPDPALVNRVAGGCDVFRLRNDYIPIIRLAEVFGIKPSNDGLEKCLLVVVEAGNAKVALVVDDLLGQQQVVIKSMEANYRKVEGISGATILGDGTVSLILDITDLIQMAGVRQQQKSGLKLVADRSRVAQG